MNWTEILNAIFELVLIPLLGIIVKYGTEFIAMKIEQAKQDKADTMFAKYMDQLNDAICRAVVSTNQTYVDALKNKNAFDAAAQKEAFQRAYNTAMSILSEDAKRTLSMAIGDFNAYVTAAIETQVNYNKQA